MTAAGVLLLFSLHCPEPCPVPEKARAQLEQRAVRFFSEKGFSVRPAGPKDKRPTGETAGPEHLDVARALGVDRVVALDMERDGSKLWITHHLRGVPGVWAVHKTSCGEEDCTALELNLGLGLRPRKATDVDLTAGLRGLAPRISRCVIQEDQVPVAERIFGKVELDLRLLPSGAVKVDAIAPARVAQAPFGACLRLAMESLDMGPFEGAPIPFRIPIDL